MRINNNIMALNAHRQLGANQAAGSKSMERLSSGLRINRAGDDAAGLAISEKMRGQIRGLKQASRNAQDAISLIQTAEGALNETHAILQRMRELATQSSSDTNTEVDRGEIQKEIDELAAEITRIADTTEFNTQNLLGGEFSGTFHIGANESQNINLAINAMDATSLGVAGASVESPAGDGVAASGTTTVNSTEVTVTGGVGEAYNDLVIKFVHDTSNTGISAAFDGTDTITVTLSVSAADAAVTAADINSAIAAISDAAPEGVNWSEISVSGLAGAEAQQWSSATDVTLTGGEDASEGEGSSASGSGGINVSTQEDADAAITVINEAIETVSAERSKLGAYQNRLEHTIANLGTSAENLQAAEARIRDLDMAEEIMAFTKNNILQQAATAMLAQANMAPQSVLQLLG